ncbi:hypothetical protein C0991_002170 [Blastosporella zonata]|nr:hypothetical protein C0991_002170 [Blastosporella zonata]
MTAAPSGMIQAVTNRQIGLKCVPGLPRTKSKAEFAYSVITELIIGFMIPGGDPPVASHATGY